jgi:hypothetical protein
MGWWEQNPDGESFGEGGGLWGDGCADVIADAIDKIVIEFQADWDRQPSKAEIRRGLEFSLRARDDLPEDSADAGIQLGDLMNRVPDPDDPRAE